MDKTVVSASSSIGAKSSAFPKIGLCYFDVFNGFVRSNVESDARVGLLSSTSTPESEFFRSTAAL
jgi:hypothetical protein